MTGKVEHTFNAVFSISDTARYGSYWFDARQTNAHYGTANCYHRRALCRRAALRHDAPSPHRSPPSIRYFPVAGTPLSQIFVERDRPSSEGTIGTMMNETDLTADFTLFGDVHNHLVTGVQLDKENASLQRYSNQLSSDRSHAAAGAQSGRGLPRHARPRITSRPLTKTATIGTYAVDNIDIGDQWSVVGGHRASTISAPTTPSRRHRAAHFVHNDNIGSPRAALVYKPTDNSSVYFSYGTSFNPSAETLSLSASNQGLAPEQDHTFEVGGKIEVLDGIAGADRRRLSTP